MKEKTWFQRQSAEAKRQMAEQLNTSVDWLYQIAGGATPSATLARQIDEYSNGEWSKHSLRPDVFGDRAA